MKLNEVYNKKIIFAIFENWWCIWNGQIGESKRLAYGPIFRKVVKELTEKIVNNSSFLFNFHQLHSFDVYSVVLPPPPQFYSVITNFAHVHCEPCSIVNSLHSPKLIKFTVLIVFGFTWNDLFLFDSVNFDYDNSLRYCQ